MTIAGQLVNIIQAGAHILNISLNPADGGAIIGGGIRCPGACSTNLGFDTVVALQAFGKSGYQFSGWTGCDNPSADACTMTMGADKSVTANFVTCPNPGVRRGSGPPAYYSTLQGAFNAAVDGDIDCQGISFAEDLVFNVNNTVTIKGGYDCNYSSKSKVTVIQGSLVIMNGKVNIDNLIIQ